MKEGEMAHSLVVNGGQRLASARKRRQSEDELRSLREKVFAKRPMDSTEAAKVAEEQARVRKSVAEAIQRHQTFFW